MLFRMSRKPMPGLSRRTEERIEEGRRQSLSSAVRTELLKYFPHLSNEDLSGYTWERRKSDYPNGKYDILVFDDEGKPVFDGREYYSGPTAYWLRIEGNYQRARFY